MSARRIGYQDRLAQAVRAFWKSRRRAAATQKARGAADQGNRAAVTAGKNMEGFHGMLEDVIHHYAPAGTEIHQAKAKVAIPGFFRPIKSWDLLVVNDGCLLAALELKSLGGPSFGNNANNRCEEAIGSGHDFRRAQSQGLFGPGAAPFLGYLLFIEDDPATRRPVRTRAPHFPNDRVFQDESYQGRMRILCERLMEQNLYSAAAVLTAAKGSQGASRDLSPGTSFKTLLAKLSGHLAGDTRSRLQEVPPSVVPPALDGACFVPLDESSEPSFGEPAHPT